MLHIKHITHFENEILRSSTYSLYKLEFSTYFFFGATFYLFGAQAPRSDHLSI